MRNKIEAWFEEDTKDFVHPRDPHHRVETCGKLQARQGSGQRGGRHGDAAAEGALRDSPAAVPLRPARGCADRPARPNLKAAWPPVQGCCVLLFDRGRRRTRRGPRVRLPGADVGGREGSGTTIASSTIRWTCRSTANSRRGRRPNSLNQTRHRQAPFSQFHLFCAAPPASSPP